MIKLLNKNDIELYEQAKQLWKCCFHDSDVFIEYYFVKRTNIENVLAYVKDGQMHGMLNMIPKTLIVCGVDYPCYLISGVATLPQCRGNGIATELINYAKSICDKSALILKPAEQSLIEFYENRGFVPFNSCKETVVINTDISNVDNKACAEPDKELMMNIYNKHIASFDTYEKRELIDFANLIEEYSMQGCLIVQTDKGYALCDMENDNTCVINELCGDREGVLSNVFIQTKCKKVVLREAGDNGSDKCKERTKAICEMIMQVNEPIQFGNVCTFFSY